MESENYSTDTQQVSQLKKITPLSKYLAMVLFIALPFIGGYIGYVSAPIEIIEVEKIITKETPATEDLNTNIDELLVGQNNSIEVAHFENKEIGIAFDYPEVWGEVFIQTEIGECPTSYIADTCSQKRFVFDKLNKDGAVLLTTATLGHKEHPVGRGGFWGDFAGAIGLDYLDICKTEKSCDVMKNIHGVRFARYYQHVGKMGEDESTTLSYIYTLYHPESDYYGIILTATSIETAGNDIEKLFEETVVGSFTFLK